jgi:hypothetical protein
MIATNPIERRHALSRLQAGKRSRTRRSPPATSRSADAMAKDWSRHDRAGRMANTSTSRPGEKRATNPEIPFRGGNEPMARSSMAIRRRRRYTRFGDSTHRSRACQAGWANCFTAVSIKC